MGRTAFVFPGQGSQAVGMGRELWEASAAARELFERADAALGFPLARLCFEGPEAELTRTENAQPALYAAGAAACEVLRESGFRPDAVAGHSLGEYTALYAAGVWSFEDGLKVVRRRGELMARVGDRARGGMAAILGLPAGAVAEVCAAAAGCGVVEVANYNTPDQTVISGEEDALELAMRLAKERGARRALRLNVAAPFHCSLMAPLAGEMARVLAAVPMEAPRLTVLANVTAEPVGTPEEVREGLRRQLAGSVRWTEIVRRLEREGCETLIEAGPGRVLTGLAPRIAPGLRALSTAEALQSGP